MKKIIITAVITLNSLVGLAQFYIQGSVKNDTDPTKIDIVFKPNFTSNNVDEFVNLFQFAVAIPVGISGGVSVSAVGVNAFSYMSGATPFVAITPYTENGERIFGFLFITATLPSPLPSWTNGVSFTGVEVTFSTTAAAQVGKMIDWTHTDPGTGGGGANNNTYYGIASTDKGDVTNYSNFFFAIPNFSFLGTYPTTDQYVQTLGCTGSVGGTASGTTTFCASGTPTITATGYSIGSFLGYQWQYSNDNFVGDINNFVGQTDPTTLTTGLVSSTTYYRLKVNCSLVSSTGYSNVVTVTVNPSTTASAGSNQSICAGNTVLLAGVIGGGATSVTWSGGAGTYTPNNTTLNAVYTPSAAEIAAGTFTLTLTTNDPPGPCVAANSNMNVTITPSVSLAAVTGGSQVCSGMNVGAIGIGAVYTDGTCKTIAKIVPSGGIPVGGLINTCVRIDATVQLYNTDPYLQRHFDLEPAVNAANATARITLYALQSEFNTYNANNFSFPDLPTGPADATGIANVRVTQFHGNGTAPANYPGPAVLINPADVDIIWNASKNWWEISFNIIGFSGLYIHTSVSNGPLPVSLISFSGYKDGSRNQLRWTSTNENNNRGFEVQRSTDGVNYTVIGFVNSLAPGGNSTNSINYNFTDNSLSGNIQYYRLRQVDFGNRSGYSNIVLIKGDKPVTLAIDGLFPNPASSLINVLIGSPKADKLTLVIMDITGRTVAKHAVNVETGSNTFPINISGLAGGTYNIYAIGPDKRTKVSRFVKQ